MKPYIAVVIMLLFVGSVWDGAGEPTDSALAHTVFYVT